jgi:hypothetical protein
MGQQYCAPIPPGCLFAFSGATLRTFYRIDEVGAFPAGWRIGAEVHRTAQRQFKSLILLAHFYRMRPYGRETWWLPIRLVRRNHGPVAARREQKITFRQMREMGVRGLLIYCSNCRCSHPTAISGDRWAGGVWLSDIEPPFVCQACGKRGADVRPDFNWDKQQPVAAMGYR